MFALLALARWRLEGATGTAAELVWPVRMAVQAWALGWCVWRYHRMRDTSAARFWLSTCFALATWFVILALRPGGDFARAQRVVEDMAFLGLYVGWAAAFEFAAIAGTGVRLRPGSIPMRLAVWTLGGLAAWIYFPFVSSVRAPEELKVFISSSALFVALDVAVLVRAAWALARNPSARTSAPLGMALAWLAWSLGDSVSLVGIAFDRPRWEAAYDVFLYAGFLAVAVTAAGAQRPANEATRGRASLRPMRALSLRSLCAGWAIGLPVVHAVTYVSEIGYPDLERVRAAVALAGSAVFFAAFVVLSWRSRRRGESSILVRAEDLEHIERMNALGRLAAGVAHDFNNLLTAIDGYAQLAGENARGESREVIEQIRVAVRRGRDLSGQLLTFGRRQRMEMRRIDVGEVVRDSRPLLERLAGETVEVDVHVDEGPHAIEGDPTRLWQVLANLVSNARDAMPDGGRVTVRVGSVVMMEGESDARRWVLLEVADTGRGMDDATRERIFEPFFTTRPGMGTGLGLSTVYGIVTQFGGRVDVDSAPGRGSVFHVFLPVASADGTRAPGDGESAHPSEDPSGAERRDGPRAPERTPVRILVVDDERAVREMACRYLRGLGYETLEAADGARALEILERTPVQLLLTDIVLPGGMDGLELARRARERCAQLRVAWMSGYADVPPETRLEAFVQKPFALADLGEVVVQALGAEAGPHG